MVIPNVIFERHAVEAEVRLFSEGCFLSGLVSDGVTSVGSAENSFI